MPLIELDLPSPARLRGGWAAFAAVCAARGWDDDVVAGPRQWLYHDGGGNWACLRHIEAGRFVLFGHDHEYSDTYFREAAAYFEEEETDLLAGAPGWWGADLATPPMGEWIGFIYGWDGARWQRADYEPDDGFESVGLLKACSLDGFEELLAHASEAPGLNGEPPSVEAMRALVNADADLTPALLETVVPGWDIAAGVAAARKFLEMPV